LSLKAKNKKTVTKRNGFYYNLTEIDY